MMSDFNLFSWDLYSLFRRRAQPQEKTDGQTPAEGDIYFFGMFPVL